MPVKLREWQLNALDLWLTGNRRGIASVVTGGGKTIFALACIQSFLVSEPRGSIVIIVPTLTLVDQWYVALVDEMSVTPQDIAVYSGSSRPDELAIFNIMVINTARTIMGGLSIDRPTMLVVDEVHRAGSAENSKSLVGDWSATLGLSATPEREHDDGYFDYLVPCIGDVFFEYSYEQAAADGVIAPFDLINVRLHFKADEKAKYEYLSRRLAVQLRQLQQGEISKEQVEATLRRRARISNAARDRVPAAVKIVTEIPSARTIVFHEQIDAAEKIARLLIARGVRVATYHSKLGEDLRRDNLRMYRRGLFDVLVTCRALDEGFNIPETAVAVIASSTASQRQRIQRLGRVLRPSPAKDAATIYTLYITESEERRLVAEASAGSGARSVTWREAVKNVSSN